MDPNNTNSFGGSGQDPMANQTGGAMPTGQTADPAQPVSAPDPMSTWNPPVAPSAAPDPASAPVGVPEPVEEPIIPAEPAPTVPGMGEEPVSQGGGGDTGTGGTTPPPATGGY